MSVIEVLEVRCGDNPLFKLGRILWKVGCTGDGCRSTIVKNIDANGMGENSCLMSR